MRYRSAVTALVVAALASGSCGDAESATADEPQDAAPGSTAVTLEEDVTTVADLAYRTDETIAHLLDVYYSPAASDGPVVVVLHGGGVDKSYGLYRDGLAPALAERGAVVFVPDWDDTFGDEPDALLTRNDGTGCAISYALTHAAGYGADPETLILFGHSGGANAVVAGGGLREPVPVADCVVEQIVPAAAGLVLWDGDWLLGSSPWDQYATELPSLLETLTPWGYFDEAAELPIVLISAAGSRDELRRCAVAEPSNPFWARDADGSHRDRLEQIGALDDGCVDNVETTEILALAMSDLGLAVRHVILEDSRHVFLGGDDQALLVEEIVAIAGR